MKHTTILSALALSVAVPVFAADSAAPRHIDISASDGVMLKGTYYAAAKPGPGVLLLHMCNSDRRAWEPLGRLLSAAGISGLALDFRGFGESGGERFENDPQKLQHVRTNVWPNSGGAPYSFPVTRCGEGGDSGERGAETQKTEVRVHRDHTAGSPPAEEGERCFER